MPGVARASMTQALLQLQELESMSAGARDFSALALLGEALGVHVSQRSLVYARGCESNLKGPNPAQSRHRHVRLLCFSELR